MILAEVVERTLNLYGYSLRKNSITVDFLKEDIPYALGDPHQLMQVFLNLIVNTERAIREVRGRGTLGIRLGKGDKTVWVSFHDDGLAIPKENMTSILDPSYTLGMVGRCFVSHANGRSELIGRLLFFLVTRVFLARTNPTRTI